VRIGADYNNAFGAKQLSALLNLPTLFNIGAIIFWRGAHLLLLSVLQVHLHSEGLVSFGIICFRTDADNCSSLAAGLVRLPTLSQPRATSLLLCSSMTASGLSKI
jgi:hypothetical protein